MFTGSKRYGDTLVVSTWYSHFFIGINSIQLTPSTDPTPSLKRYRCLIN
jgi:hypothetical protein